MENWKLLNEAFDRIDELSRELFNRDIKIMGLEFELSFGRKLKESFADLQRKMLESN